MQWKWVMILSAIVVVVAAAYLIYPEFSGKEPEVKLEDNKLQLSDFQNGMPTGFKGPTAPPTMKGPSGPPPD